MKRLLRRLSLQWRITLLTILLLATACVTMKTLLCSSGHAYMDSIGNYVMHYVQEDPQAVRVDIPDEQWKDLSERFNGEFVLELSGAKHSFCIRGWYIALAVTALGGAVAYFVSGKALKPLKRFTAKAERVQLQSLTEITLSEDEAVEFSRLSRAINQMLLRLNQAFDAQQQFVGNAAHELRTPLALMQARLDLYMATDHGDNRPETAETISMLREQTDRLSKMVRTLLDMSDLKAVPRTDKIQLAPMIEEVLADLSPLAKERRGALSIWRRSLDYRQRRACISLDFQPGRERRKIQSSRRQRTRRRVAPGQQRGDRGQGYGLRHPGKLQRKRVSAFLPGGQVPQPGKGRRGAGLIAGLGNRPSPRRQRAHHGERQRRNRDRADTAHLCGGTRHTMRISQCGTGYERLLPVRLS